MASSEYTVLDVCTKNSCVILVQKKTISSFPEFMSAIIEALTTAIQENTIMQVWRVNKLNTYSIGVDFSGPLQSHKSLFQMDMTKDWDALNAIFRAQSQAQRQMYTQAIAQFALFSLLSFMVNMHMHMTLQTASESTWTLAEKACTAALNLVQTCLLMKTPGSSALSQPVDRAYKKMVSTQLSSLSVDAAKVEYRYPADMYTITPNPLKASPDPSIDVHLNAILKLADMTVINANIVAAVCALSQGNTKLVNELDGLVDNYGKCCILLQSQDDRSCGLSNLHWTKNSCYIDSLFVALLHRDTKFINETFLNSTLEASNQVAMRLQKELNSIKKALHAPEVNEDGESSACYRIRSEMMDIEGPYANAKKTARAFKTWMQDQMEPWDVLRHLIDVFNVPLTTKFAEGDGRVQKIIPSTFAAEVTQFALRNYSEVDLCRYLIKHEYKVTEYSEYYKADRTSQHCDIFLSAPYLYVSVRRVVPSEPFNSKVPEVYLDTSVLPCASLKLPNNDFLLTLVSVIVHSGGANGGHYTCRYLCDLDNKWYMYDDMTRGIQPIGDFDRMVDTRVKRNAIGYVYIQAN